MIVKLNWDFKIVRLFILVWGLIMTESRRQAVVLHHPDSSWVTQGTIHLNSVASQSVRFAASKISSEWTDLHAWCKDPAKKVFSSRPLSRESTWHYTNNAGDSPEDLLVKYAQSTFSTNNFFFKTSKVSHKLKEKIYPCVSSDDDIMVWFFRRDQNSVSTFVATTARGSGDIRGQSLQWMGRRAARQT